MSEPVLVVDASATVAYLARQERGDDVERALAGWRSLGHQIVVPPHFWLETINALTGRGRWTGDAVLEAVVELEHGHDFGPAKLEGLSAVPARIG